MSNGANSLTELNEQVYKYRKTSRLSDPDPHIGGIILSSQFALAKVIGFQFQKTGVKI
ncbi:hypothetical protein PRVXT_000340 [Proteinivorax tanatarense]|uniref:Uncharacterized protein n=1 Tax=Proteinivorax tanatarense TaxID=1260629 RepID=A0AAU7VME7_9FIRM